MIEMTSAVAEDARTSSHRQTAATLPVLLILFVGSGCSALIYEIVWFQLLRLAIGSSSVSLGVLIGTFMGGMCIGSLLFPRLVSSRRHPLRMYALLEIAIGALGVALFYLLPRVGEFYATIGGHGWTGIFARAVICVISLLPPTILMGATLPAIARWMENSPQGIARLGFFYGANIAGAVFGCLLAGFYLLRVYDMATATWVAVCINVTVAVVSLGLSFFTAGSAVSQSGQDVEEDNAGVFWPAYVAIGLSGMAALGSEVVWTRLLSLLLGATVYTFSIILAVFLTGLGIGSSIGSLIARSGRGTAMALGVCQVGAALSIAWTGYVLNQSLPYWPINPEYTRNPWDVFQLDLVRCIWAILPATLFWGASFPLALGAAASNRSDPGRLVGGVYAANTVGAIVGALLFSIAMVAWLGSKQTQQVLIATSAASGLVIFTSVMIGKQSNSPRWHGVVGAAVLLGIIVPLIRTVPEAPKILIAFGRYSATVRSEPEYIYVGEGMNASIAVSEEEEGVRDFHVSGKVVASSRPQDMRLQLMLGHLPALIHEEPKSVLIVGCGAGVTAGTFAAYPNIERIVICEIEPLIPQAAGEHFAEQNNSIMDDPRLEIVYDDARHFIVTTDEKFDIITSDPIHPWVKGAAALYSKEYYELCKTKLKPGGVVTQWVPLYESNTEAVKSEIATFFQAFDNGSMWGNDIGGKGYDVVMLGYGEPRKIDVHELQERMNQPELNRVRESLDQVGLGTALDLLATFASSPRDLAVWLEDAEINDDGNLRLQYLAGMGINSYRAGEIYDEILVHRRFPEHLIEASGFERLALEQLLIPVTPN